MSNVPMSKIFLGIAAVFFVLSLYSLDQATGDPGHAIASGLALVASAIALRTD